MTDLVITPFLPSLEHENNMCCKCHDCEGYAKALDYVDDGMTRNEAVRSVVENLRCSYDEAENYVEIMVDTGFL